MPRKDKRHRESCRRWINYVDDEMNHQQSDLGKKESTMKMKLGLNKTF